MSSGVARTGVVSLVALWLGTAQALSGQSPPPPEVQFAREFVRVLRDSGAVGVIPLTVASTRALNGYAPNMDALRKDLAPSQATITLERWSAIPAKDAAPAVVLVVFKVEGIAKPFELSLYIEEVAGKYLLNTIITRMAPAEPPGRQIHSR